MAQKDLFTSPMARKKRVAEKYSPNTYRVISADAENCVKPVKSTTFTITNQNLIGQPSDPYRPVKEFRYNRPNANHVGFLRQDVKLLNEPLCDVYTTETASEQHHWWPHRTSKLTLKKPAHTLDTTVRNDYQWRYSDAKGNTRHSANPHKTPVLGSVPVNFLRDPSGQQRLLKEGISYEHQYDARGNPSYPPRGKRHGAFVWDQFSKDHAERLLNYYVYPATNDNTKVSDANNNSSCSKDQAGSCISCIGEVKELPKDSSSAKQTNTILPPICT